MHTTRFEIILPKERKPTFHHLTRQCKHIVNRMWQVWLKHHLDNNSVKIMREFFEEKKRRKWPVESIPKELGRDIEKILAEEYSDVNVRIRTLLQNAWTKKNKKRKAATG